MLALRMPASFDFRPARMAADPVRQRDVPVTPIDYHVACDADGRWVISRRAELIGRYYTESSARDLACCCAVIDAERGQAARVHLHERRRERLVFVTT